MNTLHSSFFLQKIPTSMAIKIIIISTKFGTFVLDTLKVNSSTLGAGIDLVSDLHKAVIASEY